jgi:hypothetical protein
MNARYAVVLWVAVGLFSPAIGEAADVTTVTDIYYDSQRNVLEGFATLTNDYVTSCYYQPVLSTFILMGDYTMVGSGESTWGYTYIEFPNPEPGVTFTARSDTYADIWFFDYYYNPYDYLGYSLLSGQPPYPISIYVWDAPLIIQIVYVARIWLGSTSSITITIPGTLCARPYALTKYWFSKDGLHSYITYYWASSSGKWQDLRYCSAREVINFSGTPSYPPPNPPWNWSFQTPYTASMGTIGQTMTDEYYPGTLTTPYISSEIVGSQKYQFSCSCYQGGNWTNIEGPNNFNMKIKPKQGGGWEYEFKKYSYQNTRPLP